MLKIAVVTRYFPSSGEPAQGRSLYETLRIVSRSAEVRVFYPNAAYPRLFQPRSRTYDKLDTAFHPREVSVNYFNYPALPLISRPLNGWMAARALLPHVRTFDPDLVFGCFLYPEGFAALKIARSLGVPAAVMSIGSDLNRIGDRITLRHTQAVLRASDCVITVCEDLRRTAMALGASAGKSRAILNGCDLRVFHPADRAQARERLGIDLSYELVVYVGRLDLKKGLRELVHAAAELHRTRPRLHCYIVGRGPDRPAVEETVRACEAGSYVHLIPGCTFDEVAAWMTAADVFSLPSYMEGCPNVVLEALACGRPVVATNVGGIPEIVSEACGSLVPPRDSTSLAQSLNAVLDRAWIAADLAARNSRSWDAPASELMQVFEELAGDRAADRFAR